MATDTLMGHAGGASWVHTYFGADYRAAAAGVLTPERTEREVDFLLAATGLRAPAAVLDLGCGHGRHVLAFARRGFAATGVDVNAESLALAEAATAAERLPAQFVRSDYRVPPAGPFDLVTSLFGSFGFASDAANARTLAAWCRRVGPGGWLVLEVWHRDQIVARFEPRRTWRASEAPLTVDERRTFDPLTSRLRVAYTYTPDVGAATAHELEVRLYTAAELGAMLLAEGIGVHGLYGSLRGDPYTLAARSLVLVGRRAADAGVAPEAAAREGAPPAAAV